MAKKQIKWANKELPGLSFDELNKMNALTLAATETGRRNVESGHLTKISQLGGKKAGDMNRENGTMEKAWKASTSNSKLQSIKGKKGGTITGNKIHTCPHCTKQGKGPAMTKHHMDNCTLWQPFAALPDDMMMTINEMYTFLNENGFDMSKQQVKLFRQNHPLIIRHGEIVNNGKPGVYKKNNN